ncbi:MAG: hydantoinase B/oxoprolinase family protein, partial [Rhodospirillales bacterium]|nr:hydantoinase B/oxoprolinase family protein [Rhodospirillales bacterium]
MRTDPVLLEILANKSVSAAVEMATTLQRTARTIFVKEAADFACALVGVDGRVFAHPPAMGVGLFVDMDAT